jgi:hypothetical protein
MSLGVFIFENGKNDQMVDVMSLASYQTTYLQVESPELKLKKNQSLIGTREIHRILLVSEERQMD